MLQALLTFMRSPAISDQHICSVVSMCFVSYRSRPKASSCSGSGTSKEAFSDKEAAGQGRRQRRCRQPQAPPRGRQNLVDLERKELQILSGQRDEARKSVIFTVWGCWWPRKFMPL
nr:uncharacterized protein LOC109781149 [Aegilops tauschii subsp. strangulata]